MIFNSTAFLIFFPVVVFLYFILPDRFRWMFLLCASGMFYAAFIPAYLLIFVALILIDYVAGILIEGADGWKKRAYLLLSVVSNLGLLGFFKYYNFFAENLSALAQFLHWNYSLSALAIILPIGLSFHTFQAMSYTIEVYRGRQKAERHLGLYALYVMFFPQLVAGPIERPQHMLPQFHSKHVFDYARVTSGLRRMLIGFFKKVVIADQAAVFVNLVYDHPLEYQGIPLILATVLFAFQVYGDFSGYSDIAVGSARVLGFDLMENFNRPYVARSIGDFWKRWHISLTSWFRDYVFIPLGWRSTWKLYRNVLILFLLSGFWHGANWTFIVWGLLHGLYFSVSRATGTMRMWFVRHVGLSAAPRLHLSLQIVVTFLEVCFAWIFFRAKTLSDAWYIVTHLFRGLSEKLLHYSLLIHSIPDFDKKNLFLVFLSLGLLCVFPCLERFVVRYLPLGHKRSWVAYYILIFWMLSFGAFIKQPFIYFQF